MEKMFGPAYSGDPGVPHTDPERFSGILWGAVVFSLYSVIDPYYWQQSTAVNWHDWAMVAENHAFKRAIRRKKCYKPMWNRMLTHEEKANYYDQNVWPDYFP